MKLRAACVVVGFFSLLLSLVPVTVAQTTAETASALPRLVRFGGAVKDLNGNPMTGVVGITFALYSDQTGGGALWIETQNVTADSNGHYVALLGATTAGGLPAEIFTSEQARWVGVQVSGQAEQARVLLVSAPYALKAGDAETVGGLPASAFMLANGSQGAASGAKGASAPASAGVQKNSVPPANPAVTGKGVIDFIPMWDSASDIIDSVIFQKTSAIGINTTAPAATLDVNGKTDIRDTLTLFPKGTDPTLAISGTAFRVDQTGKMTFISGQAFPGTGTITGITTASGSGLAGGGTKGTLNLSVPAAGIINAMLQHSSLTLTAGGGMTGGGSVSLGGSTTLGLKTCGANQVLQYVSGVWTCSNAGTGTITGVTAGTDLTGGGTSGTVTLNLDTTKVPQLNAANTFTGNQTITGNLSDTGNITSSALISGQTGSFTGSNTTQILNITQSGTGTGIAATSTSGPAVGGVNTTGGSFFPYGVFGVAQATSGGGVGGIATASSGSTQGVSGESDSTAGTGVYGIATATTGTTYGVYGSGGTGVAGVANSPSGPGGSFIGFSAASGSGLIGSDGIHSTGGNTDPNSFAFGGNGMVATGGAGYGADGGDGVSGNGGAGQVGGTGVNGFGSSGTFQDGSGGYFQGGAGTFGGDGVDGVAGSGYAGNFHGDLNVTGKITAGTKDFKIDHPLDPANKYLVHASVESSEMKNIYDGNVTTDGQGQATVQLPEWFEVLNTDFRYQLTVIGQFAQAIVAREMENNRFEIRTSVPNVKVSWQVTGVRQDAYAKANPLVVEQEKEARLRGFYIHPELYGAPAEKQIEWARHPQMMKRIKEMRAKQLAGAQTQAAPLAPPRK